MGRRKEKMQKMDIKMDAAKQEEMRDWSSLTEPLLLCILSFFTTLNDFFTFRAVCHSWRLVAVPNPQATSCQSPLVIYRRRFGFYSNLTTVFYDVTHRRNYKIPGPKGVIFGFSRGQMIVRQPENYKNDPYVSLIDLFTGVVTNLPSRPYTMKPYRLHLSSSPLSVNFFATLQVRKHGCLYFCTAKSSWKRLCKDNIIEDVLFFKNKLYVLTKSLHLGVLDHISRRHNLVIFDSEVPLKPLGSEYTMYLADSDGQLLLVCKRIYPAFTVSIWRWNFECGGGWLTMSNLGKQSLFIGDIGFFGSINVGEKSLVKQNCIYFSKGGYASLGEESFIRTGNEWPKDEGCPQDGFPMLILPSLL